MPEGRGEAARVAVVSHYNMTRHIYDSGCYEAQSVIEACDAVDGFAPPRTGGRQRYLDAARRRLADRLGSFAGPQMGAVDLDQDYDLLIFIASHLNKLHELPRLGNWRKRAKASAFILLKAWRSEMDDHRRLLPLLNDFDVVYSPVPMTIDYLQSMIRTPVRYLPHGVPALELMPASSSAPRPIDVYAMGRRPPILHDQMVAAMASDRLTYQFDAFDNLVGFVKDFPGHALLKRQTLRQTKYFANFGVQSFAHMEADMAQKDDAITARCYEGAAAGTVMFGSPPTAPEYADDFPWADAIVPAPADGGDFLAFFRDLDEQPERLARIRRDNVVNALRRHDFAYRYEKILQDLGVPAHDKLIRRKARLAEAARGFS